MVEANMCAACREAFLALEPAERVRRVMVFNGEARGWNRAVGDRGVAGEG